MKVSHLVLHALRLSICHYVSTISVVWWWVLEGVIGDALPWSMVHYAFPTIHVFEQDIPGKLC